ncbi:hypothetical protein PRUPE_4G289000 [Prunus persica]|uniref:Uncharacterized protein n=1 Tax=Prunus persica TaxID=3760 RepID=A0A251PT10_PRUPE|nr:hypothetical protein PRUPE_4G289000 [Prunus persica]
MKPNLFSKPNTSSSLNTLPSHSSPTPSVLCVFWSKIPSIARRSSLIAHHSSPSLFAVSHPNATASASLSSQSKAGHRLFLSLVPYTDLYLFLSTICVSFDAFISLLISSICSHMGIDSFCDFVLMLLQRSDSFFFFFF